MISRKGDDIMKNNIFDLSGQVALVAGGSSGLGLQFAKAMANAIFPAPCGPQSNMACGILSVFAICVSLFHTSSCPITFIILK